MILLYVIGMFRFEKTELAPPIGGLGDVFLRLWFNCGEFAIIRIRGVDWRRLWPVGAGMRF
jgi:hypothetical protein